ncbi:MAG: hypothetical protein IJZ46_02840 [Bacilli bacterium]|nr:hypothetical protein [Bacilli bacterium]
MKKTIKIIILIMVLAIVGIGSIFGYKKYSKYKSDNKIITYVLNNPVFPLENSDKEEYIVNTLLIEENDLVGRIEVKIENGKLLIDNKKTGEIKTISNISNAKYITGLTYPFVLTSDGKLYCNTSNNASDVMNFKFEEARLMGYTDIDGKYIPGKEVNEKFVALVSKVDGLGATNEYAKTEDNKYYRLNGNNIMLVEDESVLEDSSYDVAYSGYKYILYNDGKTAYADPESIYATTTPKGIVVNENGNQLIAYKFIGISQGQGYFVSNEKKLYKVSIYSVNDNDELEAQLINKSPVSTFSYKASAKEDITVKFENNETYTIENSLYKVSYKVYEN